MTNPGTFSVGGFGGHRGYFQPNPRVISQMSASHKCTDPVFMIPTCIFDGLISVYFRAYRVWTPCTKNIKEVWGWKKVEILKSIEWWAQNKLAEILLKTGF